MKHTSKLLTALLLTMAFLVSALPVHGIHAEPETATVQKNAELVFVIDSTGSMGDAINNVKTGIVRLISSSSAACFASSPYSSKKSPT